MEIARSGVVPRAGRCFIITLALVLPLLLSAGCTHAPPGDHALPGVSAGRIAFISCREDAHGPIIHRGRNNLECHQAIYVMDSGGTNHIELGPSHLGWWTPVSIPFCWSPDGGRIAFGDYATCDHDTLQYWLCLIDANGTNLTKLEMPGFPRGLSWSPDGSKIAIDCADIYVVDIDTGEAKNLTSTPDVEEALPSWSPDGKKIAFVVWHPDPFTRDPSEGINGVTSSDICLIEVDGSNQVMLTSQPGLCTMSPLAWSPNGRKVVYVSRTVKDHMSDICLLDARNGKTVKLTDSPEVWDCDPSWSPDGKKIAFVSGVQICAINADGSHLTKLTTDVKFLNRSPSWSPDGKKICFCQCDHETDASDICVIDLDSEEVINLTGDTVGDHSYCVWSPR